MKLPVPPPPWNALFTRHESELARLLGYRLGPEVKGKYEHWEHLRYLTPPPGLDHEQWWLAVKLARNALARDVPLADKSGRPFRVSVTPTMTRHLHMIDRDAAGSIRGLDRMEDERAKERYLIRSLIEEAMTSAQLEGAATTRRVAKDMLRSGRRPRDRGERMIYNNYAAMLELKRWRNQPLTPEAMFEIHRLLTIDTLDDPSAAGRFRRVDEDIVVEDEEGNVSHVPPPAHELPERLQKLCDFANDPNEDGFLHPVIRAIIIHFQIAYDHPFCDGNGRTARTLFYWSMLRSGYWMAEYLSVSSILKNAPSQYQRAYLHTETDESDLGYFVDYHLDVIVRAIESLHGYLARKADERKKAESLLRPSSNLGGALNHRQRALLLNAIRHPGKSYRIESHRRAHDITYQTARTDLLALVAAGLMRQYKQGNAFVFIAVDDLVEQLEQ